MIVQQRAAPAWAGAARAASAPGGVDLTIPATTPLLRDLP